MEWMEYRTSDTELTCPPGVRSCYECHRPASECPEEREKFRDCSRCDGFVAESDGGFCSICGTARDWICNDCAQWGELDGGLACRSCILEEAENAFCAAMEVGRSEVRHG